MRPRTTYAATVAAAVVMLATAACSGDSPSPGGDASAGAERTLTLGTMQEPSSWDSAQAHIGERLVPYQVVYDTLILREPDGSYSPMLATEWGYADDETFVLELRTDVTFSDGEVFDAEAVSANIEHFMADNGPQAGQAAAIDSVTAVGDSTVEIGLAEPEPALEYYLSQALGLMGSPAALGTDAMDSTPVGSGPFVMSESESVPGSRFVFTAREDYWNPELQVFDRVVLRYLSDVTARSNALVSGEIDAAILDAASVTTAEEGGLTLLTYPTNWTGLLLFDREGELTPALGDVRVRQAINHAFDREAMLASVLEGYGEVTSQVFGPDSSAFDPELDEYYAFDLDRARELMAEAGYADGFELTLPMPTDLESLMTFVRQQLGEIGIEVELVAVPFGDYQGTLAQGNYSAAWFNLFQGTTWVASKQLLSQETLWNPFGTETPELEQILDELVASGGDDAGIAQELNRYVTEQAWFAPWYRPDTIFMYDADSVSVVEQMQQVVPSIYNYAPVG